MKNVKRSLFTSVVSLLLCFVMLVGTTFAWFTDSVVSANNIITTGNLDVAMYWSENNTDWNNAEGLGARPVFDYDNWEPGYTEVRYIKVANEGDLSFKYLMYINPTGVVGALADVIDVSYDIVTGNDGFTAPTTMYNMGSLRKIGTLSEVIYEEVAIPGGVLLPDGKSSDGCYSGEVVYCVAFHMQELAGNEYMKQSIGDSFGITLHATQYTYESDSFGTGYDTNAKWPEKPINASASRAIKNGDVLLGALTNEVSLRSGSISATIPADVKVEDGATSLNLTVNSTEADGNLSLNEGESALGFNVHIDGVSTANTKPMIVNLGAVLPAGIDATELKLYHTENGTPVQMTRVASTADFSLHNQYVYDPATGEVSIYVASFSIFSAVKTSADVWDGKTVATGFASGSGTQASPYLIKTAAQLAYFRNQVDSGVTYSGKFVKLGADIDLAGNLFDPIGYGYTYNNDSNTAFMGTFDGGNHTIYGLYQNGWELGYSYSTAGGGLFASIENATIKNLVMDGANIVMECVDMGIVVGYAQDKCHFENIVVTNSKIANYNRATGAVVGEVCYGDYGTDISKGYSHTFKNIVVDSNVVVSSLWGSFDTLIGGVIGGKWGNATVKMENVITAAELDVYSDVTAAYQWYAYRRCGMLIGHTEQNSPKSALNADAPFLTCDNVNVYYGDWVNYNYYQFANQDSTTGQRYPWVRAEASPVGNNGAFSNPRYGVPTHTVNGEIITVNNENKDTYKTGYAAIKFDQLYGGGQGVYGKADHAGVTTTNLTDTKTIYFQNNWNWTNLKIHYWYADGDNTWTTIVDGIPLTGMSNQKEGGFDLYKFEIPAYVAGYQIEGFDSTTTTTHKTEQVLANNIVDGNIYWFIYSNGGYAISANKYETNYKTHDIYVVGSMNGWSTNNIDSKYHLTPSADGKTWTITVTFDKTTTIKLYNTMIVSEGNSRWIGGKGYDSTQGDVELAPGTYTITYSVAENNFTFNMTQRILYLKPDSNWTQANARFAIYCWYYSGSTKNEKWYSMTKQSDGTYKVAIDAKYDNVIFCRMNGSTSDNNWNNKWNQTGDLKPGDGSLYTIKTTSDWNNTSGSTWSKKS